MAQILTYSARSTSARSTRSPTMRSVPLPPRRSRKSSDGADPAQRTELRGRAGRILCRRYGSTDWQLKLIGPISLDIAAGEPLALIGPSGAANRSCSAQSSISIPTPDLSRPAHARATRCRPANGESSLRLLRRSRMVGTSRSRPLSREVRCDRADRRIGARRRPRLGCREVSQKLELQGRLLPAMAIERSLPEKKTLVRGRS